jgi:hypothetical protein
VVGEASDATLQACDASIPFSVQSHGALLYLVNSFNPLAWWLLPDSNWGHKALQASALPTELKSHNPVILLNITGENKGARGLFLFGHELLDTVDGVQELAGEYDRAVFLDRNV